MTKAVKQWDDFTKRLKHDFNWWSMSELEIKILNILSLNTI